jgi:hypothetical protein
MERRGHGLSPLSFADWKMSRAVFSPVKICGNSAHRSGSNYAIVRPARKSPFTGSKNPCFLFLFPN